MNKKLIFSSLLLLSLSLITFVTQAQENVKSEEEMSPEYQRWLKVKDDWPNLKRFQSANNELGLPAPDEDRVVFMGNSITEGWGYASPEYFEGKAYVNRGISGQTTPQMLIRFRQDVIALQPKVVIILCGTNDIAGNTGPSTIEMIQDNIASMAEIADQNGIVVILSSILPVYDYPWRTGLEPAVKIVSINKWMKSYSGENGFIYLDYFSAVVDDRKGMQKKYAKDEVHPTKEGYTVMEALATQAINRGIAAFDAQNK